MIYIEPDFGLANRMRVITSGIELGMEVKQPVVFVWKNNHELNCNFHDLFNEIPQTKFIKKSRRFEYIKTINQKRLLNRMLALGINKVLGIDYCIKDTEGIILERNEVYDAFKSAKVYNTIYLKTCGQFGRDNSLFSVFKPAPELKRVIDSRSERFSDFTYGLHIRRTDHVDAIKSSPLESFVRIIEEKLGINADSKFYLSSDDPATVTSLKEQFPSAIISYNKDFSRDTPQGIKDAVIDMFCLARTKKIFGSFKSSFSETAAKLGNIELEMVTQ